MEAVTCLGAPSGIYLAAFVTQKPHLLPHSYYIHMVLYSVHMVIRYQRAKGKINSWECAYQSCRSDFAVVLVLVKQCPLESNAS